MNNSTANQGLSSPALTRIAGAWLAAGTLDILAAIIDNVLKGNTAIGVFKAIASGVFGVAAFRGGMEYAVAGLFFHYAIMLVIVLVYFQAARRMTILNGHALLAGLAYGIGVYAFMNMVVLPLSSIAWKPVYAPATVLQGLVVHMLCVGLPIGLLARRY